MIHRLLVWLFCVVRDRIRPPLRELTRWAMDADLLRVEARIELAEQRKELARIAAVIAAEAAAGTLISPEAAAALAGSGLEDFRSFFAALHEASAASAARVAAAVAASAPTPGPTLAAQLTPAARAIGVAPHLFANLGSATRSADA